MRRIHRMALPARVLSYLDGRRQATAGASNVEIAWKRARQTRAIKLVVQTLQTMAGARERCMYCVDSHGSDIEHYRPKGPYPNHAFVWPNMLLCCTECGRFKGNRFPLSDAGDPMLVDPSAEDPWEFLDFDPEMCVLTERFDAASGEGSARGRATVDLLQLDRREALSEGYRRTFQRLARRVREALTTSDAVDVHHLVEELTQLDDHGLLGWCLGPVGANVQPFAQLRRTAPEAWAACAAAAS